MKNGKNDIDRRKLVLYLLDEISTEGRREVELWLAASGENRKEYELLSKTWKETGKLGFFPKEIDTDKTWDSFSSRLDENAAKRNITPENNPYQRTVRFLYAAAAVTFLTWISITMVRLIQNDTFKKMETLASNELVIMDTLTDGSIVRLNENSSLTFAKNFRVSERKVKLQGEAFFEVMPDTAKPFIVEAELGSVRVLGTSFQVKGFRETDMEVYVEEGIVEMSAEKDGDMISLVLVSGEKGIVKYPDGELVKEGVITPDELFWANRKLIFRETRLSLVFELLRKHYKAEIDVENEEINKCLLTATFDNEEIDQILEVIGASFELDVEKGENKFTIKGRGCSNE